MSSKENGLGKFILRCRRNAIKDHTTRGILTGAKINPKKLARAKDLRQQMTPGETALWKYLRASQLGGFHFHRQQIIEGFIVDFYCHSAGLVIEVDGKIHDTQKEYEKDRDQVLSEHGLKVIRVSEDDVLSDIASVLEKIRGALTNH